LNLWSRLVLIGRDIKLSHTVFAMPFALLAMLMAAGSAGRWPTLFEIALIAVCMVLARTSAMAFNRWADASIDAANPRTAGRAIPSGQVEPDTMATVAIGAGVGLVVVASGFWVATANAWPLFLAPFVVLYLWGYSLTKRFTSLCHAWLGTALAISPLAAVIAIEPSYLGWAPLLLAVMVACWVAGFDIIYALGDESFDREHGVHALPSKLGGERALWFSRGLHGVSAAAIIALAIVEPMLGLWFALGVAATLGLLAYEHALVWRSSTNKLNVAFFTVNGAISLLLGAAGIADIALGLL